MASSLSPAPSSPVSGSISVADAFFLAPDFDGEVGGGGGGGGLGLMGTLTEATCYSGIESGCCINEVCRYNYTTHK